MDISHLRKETKSTHLAHHGYSFRVTAVLWGIGAFIIYAFISSLRQPLFSLSDYPYYNYLADAIIHGQLHLRLIPPVTHDLVFFNQQYYLYWPPFPAIIFIPFVAILGIGFSDIFFTLCIAALNVAVVSLILDYAVQRGILNLSILERFVLTSFFAFGTVHVTLAPYGRVWFTGQLIGFLFVALAYLSVLSLRGWPAFLICGICLACAAATRNHLLFTGVWPAVYLFTTHRLLGKNRIFLFSSLGTLPLILMIGSLALYNYLRFGGLRDLGLDYHLMADAFKSDYQEYGAFNLHYLWTNFYYQYIAYPFPFRAESLMGGSLFLLSPVFFAVFSSLSGLKSMKNCWSVVFLSITILLVSIPILLLMGTGWIQFGPRYTLDFTVPLLLLTGTGIQRWPDRFLFLLASISISQYFIGTILFSYVL